MATLRLATVAAALLLTAFSAPLAQDIVSGDAAAGDQTYGTQCATCHGAGGNSVVPAQPIIASQYAEYTVSQLRAYRSGDRVDTVMQTFAAQLSDEDIDNIAVYLAGQKAGLSGATDPELAERGESLYRNGIVERGVPSCTGCHGPSGKGIPPLYPMLTGQHAAYTAKTLTELRDGVRVHEVMQAISAGLKDDEIAALSEYISGLH